MKIYYAVWEIMDDTPSIFLGRTEKECRDKLWACLNERIGSDHVGDTLDAYIEASGGTEEHITIDSQEIS